MTNPKRSRRERQLMIAEEFGESFERVIRGFRADGHSWNTIAGALEMPAVTLRKWAKALGLLDKRRNCPPRRKPINERAKALGYIDAVDMVRQWRMEGKTRLDIATALHCHPASLFWYTPEEVKGQTQLTDKQRTARRRSAMRLNDLHAGKEPNAAPEPLSARAERTELCRLMRSKGWTWWAVGTCWIPAGHRRGHG